MSVFASTPEGLDPVAYVKCLVAVAKADGDVSAAERDYVDAQARAFGVDATPLWENEDPEEVIDGLDALSRTTRMFILRDCIVLGHVDSDFVEEERDRILALTRVMGVSEQDFIRLEKWLEDYFDLMARGQKLLQGN